MADEDDARDGLRRLQPALYCAQVVEFMGRGYSLTAFAGEIGVSRATLDRWYEDHPTFTRAVDRAQAARTRRLEDHFINAKGSSAAGLRMQALKTAAPDEWPAKGVRPAARRRRPAAAAIELPDNGRD